MMAKMTGVRIIIQLNIHGINCMYSFHSNIQNDNNESNNANNFHNSQYVTIIRNNQIYRETGRDFTSTLVRVTCSIFPPPPGINFMVLSSNLSGDGVAESIVFVQTSKKLKKREWETKYKSVSGKGFKVC